MTALWGVVTAAAAFTAFRLMLARGRRLGPRARPLFWGALLVFVVAGFVAMGHSSLGFVMGFVSASAVMPASPREMRAVRDVARRIHRHSAR